jgi:hypothetical protein
MFIQNLPAINVKVCKTYLTDGVESGLEDAYLLAVKSIAGRPLLFTVYLDAGAAWSGLPITAIYCDRFNPINYDAPPLEIEEAQPFSCLEGDINVITYDLLKNAEAKIKIKGEVVKANYLFTIDYLGEGLSEDPSQHKTHNIFVLDTGQLVAYPNNMILWQDGFFAYSPDEMPKYKRTNKYWLGSK